MVLGYVLGALGAVVVLVVVADTVWTVLAAGSGLGPVAQSVVPRVWHVVLRRHHARHDADAGTTGHRRLRRIGLAVVGALLLSQVLLLLTGWTLVFQAQPGALVVPPLDTDADFGERAYYAGFTVFTLGVGDVVPATGPARVATVLAAATGLLLITLVITYAVPLLDAYAQKRTLAATITGLGRTPAEIVVTAWDGEDLPGLADQVGPLTEQISTMAQQHVSYPLLDMLHAEHAEAAAAVAVAVLDEAVTLLEHGVAEQLRPAPVLLRVARRSVGRYLATAADALGEHEDGEVPPAMSLDPLRRHGIPCVSDEEFRDALTSLADRRRRLQMMVHADGWTWDDVIRPQDDDGLRTQLPTTDEAASTETQAAAEEDGSAAPAPE